MEEIAFLDYMGKINESYAANTEDFDFVFPETVPPTHTYFHKGIACLIDWFLEESSEKKLFIQAPVKEMGSQSNADENLMNLTKVIGHLLGVHGIAEIEDNITPNLNDGEIIYINQEIKGYRRFFQVRESKSDLKEIHLPQLRTLPVRIKFDEYHRSYANHATKLSSLPFEITRNQRQALVEQLIRFSTFRSKASNLAKQQFRKILIIGYAKSISKETDFPISLLEDEPGPIKTSLYFSSNSDNIPNDIDLVLIIGEKKYKYGDLFNRINNKLNRESDQLKKVVFIGNDIDQAGILTYSFSYREMAFYFRNNCYHNINYKSFPIEGATAIWNQFLEVLDQDPQLELSSKYDLLAAILDPIFSIEFNPEEYSNENVIEIVAEKLNECYLSLDTEFNFETYNKLKFEIENMDFELENLKSRFVRNNLPKGGKNITIPKKKYAYKQKLKEYINKNKGTDKFIFDSISVHNLEIYKELIKHGTLGQFIFLYYQGFEEGGIIRHTDYLKKEHDTYRQGLRIELTGVEIDLEEEPKNLENYDVDLENAMNKIRNEKWNSGIEIILEFDDGSRTPISGNVLYKNELTGIEAIVDMWEDGKEDKSFEITFYENPEQLFQKIATEFRGYDLQMYVSLWKNKLYSICENKYAGNIENLYLDLKEYGFTSKWQLPHYLELDNETSFARDMLSIVRFLRDKEYLTEVEGKRIMQARRVLAENQRIGVMLKDELFEYIINGHEGKLLGKVTENSDLSIEEIKDAAIHTKSITGIKVKE